MIRLFTILLLPAALLLSCASVEEVADTEPELETEEEVTEHTAGELSYPQWYESGVTGSFSDGKLTAFARAPGSDEEWARQSAEGQAQANLRVWVDEQVEKARAEVAAENENAAERGFIMNLRNAVNNLNLDNIQLTDDQIEDSSGTRHVFVRAEAVPSDLLAELGDNLSNYTEIWSQMIDVDPLKSWREPLK